MRKCFLFGTALILSGLLLTGCKENSRLFVGGFTIPGPKGLSVFDFNSRNGDLKLISESDVGPNPSYFCYSGNKKLIYILNEVMEFNGTFGGGLTTFKYDAKIGTFEKLNEILIPYGGPCYISMSPDSSFLFVANYPNGSVAVVKLDGNGIPESITDTLVYYMDAPKPSHAHMILNDPSGERVYVTDLGLDRIMEYNFDRNTGKLNWAGNDTLFLPVGSGPRHFAFNADGSKMYVINELGSKMMVINVDKEKGLKLIQTLPTFRQGFEGNNYCADIHMSKDGKYLYGSNRGDNSIVTFRIDNNGLLSLVGHTSCGGNWPRNFVINPSGKFLLVGNQKSNDISVFKIDKRTGLPVEPAKQVKITAPACLKFINVK
ncbi:MAG: lactonase family protein [Bacteroidetes bacterium]|nr:lactonase family protein [Bacteroidota bacterium]